MHKIVILISVPPDDDVFDLSWPAFLKQAEQMPGLLRETTSRVHFQVYGDVACRLIHELHFNSLQALETAMQSEEGKKTGLILQQITAGQFSLYFADHHEDDVENLQPPEAV